MAYYTLELGASTTFWVAVKAWTVVIKPSMIPNLSLMTLANGARQLVVQEALLERKHNNSVCQSSAIANLRLTYLTIWSLAGLYLSRFTPHTYMGASADGAEMMTFFAPPAT